MSAALSIHQIPISTALLSLRRRPKPPAIRCAARSDSLDHLQRATKQPPLQEPAATPQTIRRRATPVGLWGQIPAARTVQQMMDTMERLMEDPLFSESEAAAAASGGLNGYRRGGRTPWEIREVEGEYMMRFDMPGMTKRDVRLWVEEGMLVIKAEKEEQPAASAAAAERSGVGRDWPAKSFGRYSSRIALPENAVVEKIAAEVRDGVLYVTVPKAAPTTKVLDIAVQ